MASIRGGGAGTGSYEPSRGPLNNKTEGEAVIIPGEVGILV
jgi:hypothetical protein